MPSSKFTPLDLSAYFNADRSPKGWHPFVGPRLLQLPVGDQVFWGVPFQLGPAEGSSWIVVDKATGATTIEVDDSASYILFAHLCDVSHDVKGKENPVDYVPGEVVRLGEHVADYVLDYSDGEGSSQSIRRRFEVGEATYTWGQEAFAARPQVEHSPLDWRGPYPATQWGKHQQGVSRNPAPSSLLYWVYALPNSRPDRKLVQIRVEPVGDSRLVIGGITLYHGVAHPLQHRRLESMRVFLPRPALAAEVEANVDLGIIARKYAVPAFDPQMWLDGQPKGWGEEQMADADLGELHLDITASPDATLVVDNHDVHLGPVYAAGEGTSADGQVRVELLTPRKTWLHVTVLDNDTGTPTPVRIHFRAPDGRYLPPYGHRHEVNDNWFEDYGGDLKLGSTQYAYVDGRFQVELPVGEVYVEMAKGFEYQPVRQRLQIKDGQRELQLSIDRTHNWREDGWVTADSHVHFVSPQTAWLEAKAEGVNLVNLLASQWGDLFTNVGDLTGEKSGASRDDTIVWVGTENRQHILGHMSLLGVKGDPVFPMCTGGPSEAYLGDPTWMSMAEWSDLCREREGVVVLPHFPNPYCEAAADIVLGKVDAAEIRYFSPALDSYNIREWYRFLNCGYRVAAVGGTDKMSAGMPIGGVRTYAQLGDREFTFANWAKSVRSGQTFTTSGPLLWLDVDGRSPGEEVKLPRGGGTLSVRAWAQSVQPFHELQLLVNGQVVARESSSEGTLEMRMSTNLKLADSAWVAARCVSRLQVWHVWPIHIAAHTSPLYVVCDKQELFSPSDATYMLTMIDGGLTWLDTLSIPADPQRLSRIRGVFQDAQQHLNHRVADHEHRT